MSNVRIIKRKGKDTLIAIGDEEYSMYEIADQLGYSYSCYRKRVSKFQTGDLSQEQLFTHNPRDGETLNKKVCDFLQETEKEYLLFDLATILGINQKTINGIANQLFHDGKLEKRFKDGFVLYKWSTSKKDGGDPLYKFMHTTAICRG